MPSSVPPISRGTVRQGGKEELRASVLKTYLLRLRAEKGERAARQLLVGAGIDPSAVDNETGWVSQLAAKRALRAIAELLGRDAVRHRGEWVTHPEALGVMVRMLRTSEKPLDAYRYLAANAREATRVGNWEIEEPGKPAAKAAKDDGDKADKAREPSKGKGQDKERSRKAPPPDAVRMTYRPREEGADDSAERSDLEGERRLWESVPSNTGGDPQILAVL